MTTELKQLLSTLKLPTILAQLPIVAKQAADQSWSHTQFLQHLLQAEANDRSTRATERRIRNARFPVCKTVDQFDWSWPIAINRALVQHLLTLEFLTDHHNVIFLGPTGAGKSHLAVALGFLACQNGVHTRFVSTIDLVNHLCAAAAADQLKSAMRTYTNPRLLILDEIGYLPATKSGADILFQVLSARYERASTILTTNKAYKDWPEIFNNDATLASAILDRLLHRASTVVIDANSYRMKNHKRKS